MILKNFDEGFNILTAGEITSQNLQSFISINSEPLIIKFNPENARTIFEGFEKSPSVLLLTGDDAQITEEIRSVARELRGEFRFVSVDLNLEQNFRLLDFLGVTNRGVYNKRHFQNLILLCTIVSFSITSIICTFTVEQQ